MRSSTSCVLTLALSALSHLSFAQIPTFQAIPTVVNPAYSGIFDDGLTLTGIYDHIWPPYFSYADQGVNVAADAKIVALPGGDYLSGALQLERTSVLNQEVNTTLAAASLAYHKILGTKNTKRSNEIALGLQSTYLHEQLDFMYLFAPPQNYSVDFFPIVKGGLLFSHTASKFSYHIGLADNFANKFNAVTSSPEITVPNIYTVNLDACWQVSSRFAVRPAFYYIGNSDLSTFIAGNEFRYGLRKTVFRTVFAGVYYTINDAIFVTAGAEIKRFRIEGSYRYDMSAFAGADGYSVALKYTAPRFLTHKKVTPVN